MNETINFDAWIIAVTTILELDENLMLVDKCINGKKNTITLKQFYDTALQHEGWQQTIMKVVDHLLANKLFYNGIDYVKQDVINARALVLDYFADFVINALMAKYKFA